MRESGREEEKRETRALCAKIFFTGPKSRLLQCIQMAYIDTKTSKITKNNKSI